MTPRTIILAILGLAPFTILFAAFVAPLIRLALTDAHQRRAEREAERHRFVDRETARAIGIGGAATHFEREQ